MKASKEMNLCTVVDKLKAVFLFTFIFIGFIACTEESSDQILSDVPFYQKYKVAFSDQETIAYARFTKEKDMPANEIKLVGEQAIQVNGKNMEYHHVDPYQDLDFTYSLALGNVQDVTFHFVRAKGKLYENKVSKLAVSRIAIPQTLSVIKNGEAFSWDGEKKASEEMITAVVEKQDKNGFITLSGKLTDTEDAILFEHIPAGEYMLTVMRSKVMKTQANDLPAKGDITVTYFDKKKVTVK